MNFTKTLTSLAIGTAAIFGTLPEVKAAPIHDTILSQVKAAGVEIIDGAGHEFCETDANGVYTKGAYNPARNVMVLCTNNFSSEADFLTTFTHEAVHVAQDCKTGIYSKTDTFLGEWKSLVPHLSENSVNTIVELYAKEHWGYEVEAFYLQNKPSSVSSLLQKYCF